jgi:hypothetical protein
MARGQKPERGDLSQNEGDKVKATKSNITRTLRKAEIREGFSLSGKWTEGWTYAQTAGYEFVVYYSKETGFSPRSEEKWLQIKDQKTSEIESTLLDAGFRAKRVGNFVIVPRDV